MVSSRPATVAAYLAALPADRRAEVEAVRDVVRANLDPAYEEGIQYGMIGWYVPHRLFPAGYHCDPKQPLPFAALAAMKNGLSLHLMGLYVDGADDDARWFVDAWRKTGKKLDMGKACVRFARAADAPLAVIGEAIARMPAKGYIARYQAALAATRSAKPAATAKAKAKPTAKAKAKPTAKANAKAKPTRR